MSGAMQADKLNGRVRTRGENHDFLARFVKLVRTRPLTIDVPKWGDDTI